MARKNVRRETPKQGRTSSRKRQAPQETMGLLPDSMDPRSSTERDNRKQVAPLVPKNPKQAAYMTSIRTRPLTFGVGVAGSGKSFTAVAVACEMFQNGDIDSMIFCRPAQDAGEELGVFPGDIDEKLAPWVLPIRDILERRMGAGQVEYFIKRGRIKFQPFATMRGLSWDRTFILLDEAQNTTPRQMELFLSRVGEGSIVVVDGDVRQKDITGRSGLEDALSLFGDLPQVGVVEFESCDIVRSGFCRMVVEAYNNRKG